MNATPPFDGMMAGYVFAFAAGALLVMRFAPPFGAKHTLGGMVDRYAQINSDELEDAVEEEGKHTYLSWAGLFVVLVHAVAWRILMFYGLVLHQSLKAAGASDWLAFACSVLIALPMAFLLKYSTRWLIMRRLDKRFARA